MTTTYIGYQSPAPDWPWATLRTTGSLPPELAGKVNEFPSKLPGTCKLIGTWAVSGNAPNVVVVEAESFADLQYIDSYYAGWVLFDWHPCTPMPRNN